MNRPMMIAVFTAIGVSSFAVLPTNAQEQSLLDARITPESAPKTSGALPAPSLQLGPKGSVTIEQGQQASGSTKPLSPLNEPLNLPIK